MTYKIPMKILMDENTVWSVKTTYMGKGSYNPSRSSAAVKADSIRQIVKYVETTNWAQRITETYLPVDEFLRVNDDMIFIWDNRASYTYQ